MAKIEQVRLRRWKPARPEEIDPPPPRPEWARWRLSGGAVLVLLLAFFWWHGFSPMRVHRTITNAYLSAMTRVEIHNIAEQVRLHHLVEERYPDDFRTFLTTFQRPRGGNPAWTDFWGREYLLERGRDSFEVRSAGPDRRYYTADDYMSDGSVLPKEVR